MDGGRTIQFVLKLMLNVVNLIVDNQQISVGGNLSVEGNNQSAWTVVMDNQVMHAVDKGMGKNDLFDFLY